MRTRVKDFIEISDHTSLDRLITTLVAIRDSLPAEAEPELKRNSGIPTAETRRTISSNTTAAIGQDTSSHSTLRCSPREFGIRNISTRLEKLESNDPTPRVRRFRYPHSKRLSRPFVPREPEVYSTSTSSR